MEVIIIRHGIAHAYSMYLFPFGRMVKIGPPKNEKITARSIPVAIIANEDFMTNGRVGLPSAARLVVNGKSTVINAECTKHAMSENLVVM